MVKGAILVVDDEATIVDVTKRYLEREGFEVLTANEGKTALNIVRSRMIDLIITDIMMPEMDGFDFMEAVLDYRPEQPFLFITAKTEERDRLYALTLGADDYVIKPFSPRELVLRVKNILNRIRRGANQTRIQLGPLIMQFEQRTAMLYQTPVSLTNKEFDLLWLLASEPNRVFSKSELYHQVWEVDYFDDANTLNVHVHDVRDKLQQIAGDRPVPSIKTVWGLGYRLEDQAREIT